jgi:RNA polymerase sigma-70 factor (ECF subfamily)
MNSRRDKLRRNMCMSPGPGGFFEATLWSTIIEAKQEDDARRAAALERLLARYRKPILRHIQACQRCSPEVAEDLCHDFIQQCLRLEFLKNVDPSRGRFRTFIKTCIANFLRTHHAKENALKRGGAMVPVPLDASNGKGSFADSLPAVDLPPEQVLDRQWALSVLEQALEALRQECVAARRGAMFEALQGQLGRVQPLGSAAEIGDKLGMQESAVHMAMSRLRTRLGELIEDSVRQTVGSEGEWRDELRYLVELLGG